MKLSWLHWQLYHEPAFILPSAHESIRRMIEDRRCEQIDLPADPATRALVHALDPEAAKRQANYYGSKIDLPSMQIVDGIAHIPIGGVMGLKLSSMAKIYGGVDTQDVIRDIDEAEEDPSVKGALFEIDSPGGMVTGTAELADRMAAMRKPTLAFTDVMMASAAYWAGSATGGIFATRSAQIGSIGVLLPVLGYSDLALKSGICGGTEAKIDVELIKAGKLKGLGFPGTSLSKEGRAYLQDRVDGLYSDFKAQVRSRRGAHISDDSMQGQTFFAPEAVTRGLIDGVVTSKAQVVAMLK